MPYYNLLLLFPPVFPSVETEPFLRYDVFIIELPLQVCLYVGKEILMKYIIGKDKDGQGCCSPEGNPESPVIPFPDGFCHDLIVVAWRKFFKGIFEFENPITYNNGKI